MRLSPREAAFFCEKCPAVQKSCVEEQFYAQNLHLRGQNAKSVRKLTLLRIIFALSCLPII